MSCKCCCTHGHTAIQEKRNSLLKDYWRIILSTLLLFGSLILNATDATFFKGEYVPFIWYLLAYLPVGLPVMREAWESILQKANIPKAVPSCSSTPWESSFRTKP